MDILVIEHDYIAREIVKEELSRLRFIAKVRVAATEASAEEMLSTATPDAVLLDMQLPECGAYRIAGRVWPAGIPLIVCITAFERELVERLSRHRVEYLIRPFSAIELEYVLTGGRRPNGTSPAENLRRLLEVAVSFGQQLRTGLSVSRDGMRQVIATSGIIALRRDRGRICLWTAEGIFETSRPLDEVWAYIDHGVFRRLHRDSFLRASIGCSTKERRRAKLWLKKCALLDFLLNRPASPGPDGSSGAAVRNSVPGN